MATLERVYTSAKELLGSGPVSRDICWELWRLRGELRELRCSWRRELQHHLNLIDDPREAGWFKRMFSRQRTIDRKIHGQITEGQLQLGLIEYSLRLDQVLAIVGGTVSQFESTLADELVELDRVARLLREKANLISGKYPELSVEPIADGMRRLIRQYRELLPEEQPWLQKVPALPISAESTVDSPPQEVVEDAGD